MGKNNQQIQINNGVKSFYILKIYEYLGLEEPGYRTDDDARLAEYRGDIGFGITFTDVGYFEALDEAEKCIKRIAGGNSQRIYGFVVKEKPLGHVISGVDDLSVRRYLKDGSLWQVCNTSGVAYCEGKRMDLGDTCFYGRDPSTICFKEGDIVEIAGNDFVELGIVWRLPATKEQMKDVWELYCKVYGAAISTERPDILDDCYVTAVYNPLKIRGFCRRTEYPAVVNVLPPSLPVPKNIADTLRERLEMLKKEKAK
jgi:hypothetical protein